MINQEKFGKFIEKLRRKKDLKQGDLANKLGLSNSAISKWECGNNLPDISMLEPLSQALGVTINNLLKCQEPSEEEVEQLNNAKVRKKCFDSIKYLTWILFLVLTVLLCCLPPLIKYTNGKLNPPTIIENRVRVYKIVSEDKTFAINGYIIFDTSENIIEINKLVYQSPNIGKDDEVKAENIKIRLIIDDKIIFFYETDKEDNKVYTLSDILSQVSLGQDTNIETNYKLADLEEEFSKASLKIECYREGKQVEEFNINIALQEKFTEKQK